MIRLLTMLAVLPALVLAGTAPASAHRPTPQPTVTSHQVHYQLTTRAGAGECTFMLTQGCDLMGAEVAHSAPFDGSVNLMWEGVCGHCATFRLKLRKVSQRTHGALHGTAHVVPMGSVTYAFAVDAGPLAIPGLGTVHVHASSTHWHDAGHRGGPLAVTVTDLPGHGQQIDFRGFLTY